MNKFILAAALATGIFGFGAVAQAGEGIPNLPAQPLRAQTVQGVIGQGMPSFGGTATPVVSARFADSGVIGEGGAAFVNPARTSQSGVAYAQIGRPQGASTTAVASALPVRKLNG